MIFKPKPLQIKGFQKDIRENFDKSPNRSPVEIQKRTGQRMSGGWWRGYRNNRRSGREAPVKMNLKQSGGDNE